MLLALSALAHAQQAPPQPLPDARFALALFCNPTCSDSVMDTLDDGLRAIRSREGFADQVTSPQRIMGLAGVDFGIPDAEYVATYGLGVDNPEALARSEELLLAWFAGPREEALATLAVAHGAFANAAKEGGGWVEDLDTGTVYGAAAWSALDPRSPITEWFVVEGEPMAEGQDTLRLSTRGLRRYGLPELVVESVAAEAAGDVSFVVNAVADTLYSRSFGTTVHASTVEIATDLVTGTASFSPLPESEAGAGPRVRVKFEGSVALPGEAGPMAPAPSEETGGSPLEPVAPLAPAISAQPSVPAAEAPPVAVAEVSPARAAVGTAPVMSDARAPNSLSEAKRAARDRLDTVVREAWNAGLPEGSVVAVSAPFHTKNGGVEYLWVEVRQWSAGNLAGVLANEPYHVANLHKGDTVAVRFEDVFDYIWKRPDGTREGNTTAAFRGK